MRTVRQLSDKDSVYSETFFLNQECFYHVSVDDESHLNQAEKRQMKSSNCLNVSWLIDVLPHHLEAVLHFSSSEDNDRTNLIASIGRPACIKQLAAIESSFAIRRSFPPSFRLNSVNLQLGHFFIKRDGDSWDDRIDHEGRIIRTLLWKNFVGIFKSVGKETWGTYAPKL